MIRIGATKRKSAAAYIGCCALLVSSNIGNLGTGIPNVLGGARYNTIFCQALIPHPSTHYLLPIRTQSNLIFSSSSLPLHRYRNRSNFSLAMSTSSATGKNLVSIQEAIQAHTQNRNPPNRAIFIDGSWHMPTGASPRNGRSEFISGPRIPGACYFDIDDVCAPKGTDLNPKSLPHMKPPPKLFAVAMDQMGITPDDTLYVYATEGCGFVHRTYWTLRSSGHDPSKVKLVQGSLDEWKKSGGELEYGEITSQDNKGPSERGLFRMSDLDWENMTPKYACWKAEDSNVVSLDQVLDVVNQSVEDGSEYVIVDARSSGRFFGKEPEPRPGLRGGHMPGAFNVPFVSLLDPNDMTKFRPMEEVKDIFIKAGVQPDAGKTKVICSCGSGVTAAALAVAIEECGLRGKDDIFIFDGSWIEWGGDDTTPIVTSDE